jgi:hypothetical protein
MQRAFAALGLTTEYGGVHSHGRTHMTLLGFADGSYLELIAPVGGQRPPVWPEHMRDDGGLCAWAIRGEDLGAEAARLRDRQLTVTGPVYYNRRRSDGVLAEWDAVFVGDPVRPGATLPFLIQDRTPRSWRVAPSPGLAATAAEAGRLSGVDTVILGVRDLAAVTARFRDVFGWSEPGVSGDPVLQAQVATFERAPVALATPAAASGWLADRLARFGDGPSAILIGTDDPAAAGGRFPTGGETCVGARSIRWIDAARLLNTHIGFVAERDAYAR